MDAVGRALRTTLEAAGELARSASQVAGEPRSGADAATTIPAARLALSRLRDQARDLLARLDDADTRLSTLETAARTARSLDPGLWPQRRDAIAAKLAAGPLDGAATWLAAWARAFLLGCPAEADRLVTEPFRLPPEAAWCPDRLGTAGDALTARSVRRLEPLLRYLAAGAPLGDGTAVPDDLRARALIMQARLLLHAGQPAAAAGLITQAGSADHRHEAEVLAARAAMVRLRGEPGQPEAAAAAAKIAGGARIAANPDITRAAADLARHPTPEMEAATAAFAAAQARADVLAEEAAALARRAWQAERCAATAVEMFHAGRRALDSARALVDELPAMAGLEGALDVLILPVPDEIWLAAADRAARERDYGAAGRLAGRIGPGADPLLAAAAADLQARIGEAAGSGTGTVAGLLSAAGLANAVAGRAQLAIERYTAALTLVSDHQDATLGLADALLVAGWGKPLRDVAGQFHRAAGLLDACYARHPLDTRSSWSLMTYSYLASGLANQAAAQPRARELWRAPVAAARAIAFDPSQAARWVRLAETLIEVNCLQAAAVISSHATKLAPGDPLARRNRIATLANLGQADAALALLGQAAPEAGDGWYSAVRAIVLQISARGRSGRASAERLGEALAAANEAVRIEPLHPWYHLVRGNLLRRVGKDGPAGEDFEYLWRESRLDEADGLGFAARAAVELQLGSDAVALSTQALELAAATAGDYTEWFNRGAALALAGDPQGLPCLGAAVRLAMTPLAIDHLHTRLDHLTAVLRGNSGAPDLTGVARALDDRSAQIAADTRTPKARIAAELDRVAGNEHYPAEVSELATLAAGLTRAWCGLALGDPGAPALLGSLAAGHPDYPELAAASQALATAPRPGRGPAGAPGPPVPGDQALQAFLPVSWFAGLADPMDHEIIKRFVPDARDRLRRRTGAILPGVNFRDDAGLEPAGFRILLHGAEVAAGGLDPARWYCPAHLAAALRPRLRADLRDAPAAAGPESFPVLLSLPAPAGPDPLTELVAWPPAEVVTRRMELAFDTWRAAQADAGQA